MNQLCSPVSPSDNLYSQLGRFLLYRRDLLNGSSCPGTHRGQPQADFLLSVNTTMLAWKYFITTYSTQEGDPQARCLGVTMPPTFSNRVDTLSQYLGEKLVHPYLLLPCSQQLKQKQHQPKRPSVDG